MKIRTAGAFVEWAAFVVEDAQGFDLLGTGASRTGGSTCDREYVESADFDVDGVS